MNAGNLNRSLQLCKDSLMSLDFVPILTHFCFDAPNKRVYAYNDITAVSVALNNDLHLALHGTTLLNIVATLPEKKEVEFSIDKQEASVVLSCGRTRMDLKYLEPDQFLFNPGKDEKAICQLPISKTVLEAVKLCLETVGDDAMNKALTGIKAVVEEGKITLYSCNNVCLSRCVAGTAESGEAVVLLPKTFCQQLVSIASAFGEDGETGTLRIGKTSAWATWNDGGVTLFTKLMDDKPPEYEEMLNKLMPPVKDWIDVPTPLPMALERASVMVSKDVRDQCRLTISGNKLVVDASGALGDSHDEMRLNGEPPDVEVTVTIKQVQKALGNGKKIAITKDCIALRNQSYVCVVSTIKE